MIDDLFTLVNSHLLFISIHPSVLGGFGFLAFVAQRHLQGMATASNLYTHTLLRIICSIVYSYSRDTWLTFEILVFIAK
jgi:hypothetical protein